VARQPLPVPLPVGSAPTRHECFPYLAIRRSDRRIVRSSVLERFLDLILWQVFRLRSDRPSDGLLVNLAAFSCAAMSLCRMTGISGRTGLLQWGVDHGFSEGTVISVAIELYPAAATSISGEGTRILRDGRSSIVSAAHHCRDDPVASLTRWYWHF
jgi:hypothetical protein